MSLLPGQDERNGPLPALLLLLTIVTGLVDAVSYLALGHVFVANMTGNVVFLGFTLASSEFSVPASLVAIAGSLAGALIGGRVGQDLALHRGRLLAATALAESVLVAAGLALASLLPAARSR